MKYFWILTLIFVICSVESVSSQKSKSFVVVIDPGHGGKDPGTIGHELKVKEKDVNLAVALKLGELIQSNNYNVKVIYTRDKDTFISLDERASKANKSKADLFISIHANASDNLSAHGTEIYTLGLSRSQENIAVARRENAVILLEDNYEQTYEGYDPKSVESYIMFQFMHNQFMEQSIAFAADIQGQFIVNAKRSDRGVRQAGFLVIRKTSMPSVLIELGFLSNKREEAYLNSKEGQRSLARCIYNAFDKYKREYDRKMNVNTATGTTTESTSKTASETEEQEQTTPIVKPETKPASKPETKSSAKPETKSENILQTKVSPEKKTETATQTKATQEKAPKTTTTKNASATQKTDNKKQIPNSNVIIYKVQILAAESQLPKNSPRLQGYREDYYVENGLYKYTVGETTDFEEAQSIRNSVAKQFTGAFIVKFKGGKRLK